MNGNLLTGLVIGLSILAPIVIVGLIAAVAARRRSGQIEEAREARIKAEVDREEALITQITAAMTDEKTERVRAFGRAGSRFLDVQRVIGETEAVSKALEIAGRGGGTGGDFRFVRTRPAGMVEVSVTAPRPEPPQRIAVIDDGGGHLLERRRRSGGDDGLTINNICGTGNAIYGNPGSDVPAVVSNPQIGGQTATRATADQVRQTPTALDPNPRTDTRPISNQPKLTGVRANPGEIEVDKTTKIKATLDKPAPDGGLKLTVSVSDAAVLEAPTELVIPAGQKEAELDVKGKVAGEARVSVKLGTFGKEQIVKVKAAPATAANP